MGGAPRVQLEYAFALVPRFPFQGFDMTISMYQVSVPRFVNILGNLSNILDKAQANVDAKKLDAATLTAYRLFPDMLPMTSQVQIACDTAKGAVARVAGMEIPVYEDNEQTLADLKARIDHRLHPDRDTGADRRHRRQRNRDQARRQGNPVQRHAIPARSGAAEFLFSCHHCLQHLAPQWDRDRQTRLLRQSLSSLATDGRCGSKLAQCVYLWAAKLVDAASRSTSASIRAIASAKSST